MRSIYLSSRKLLVRVCRHLADFEVCDSAVCQTHRDPIIRLQEPQQVEHRWTLMGVDMAQNDRRTDLTRRRPWMKPSRFRKIGGHLDGPVRIEPKCRHRYRQINSRDAQLDRTRTRHLRRCRCAGTTSRRPASSLRCRFGGTVRRWPASSLRLWQCGLLGHGRRRALRRQRHITRRLGARQPKREAPCCNEQQSNGHKPPAPRATLAFPQRVGQGHSSPRSPGAPGASHSGISEAGGRLGLATSQRLREPAHPRPPKSCYQCQKRRQLRLLQSADGHRE